VRNTTQIDIAKWGNVTPKTLQNWKKDAPDAKGEGSRSNIYNSVKIGHFLLDTSRRRDCEGKREEARVSNFQILSENTLFLKEAIALVKREPQNMSLLEGAIEEVVRVVKGIEKTLIDKELK